MLTFWHTKSYLGGLKGYIGPLVSPSRASKGQTLGSLGATPKRGIQNKFWNFYFFLIYKFKNLKKSTFQNFFVSPFWARPLGFGP